MPGLLVLPTFDAHYAFPIAASHPNAPRLSASLSLDGAGLAEGGLRTAYSRAERPRASFLLSAHRPFVLLVRHRPTNAIALAALIEDVHRDTREYRYKERRVQWLEDRRPIVQFD